MVYEGLRSSLTGAVPFGVGFTVGLELDVEAIPDDRGAESVFFMREKMEVTKVYEDWSFSSSSENGLKEVKEVTSSVNLELLLGLLPRITDCPSKVPRTGEAVGDSMAIMKKGDTDASCMEWQVVYTADIYHDIDIVTTCVSPIHAYIFISQTFKDYTEQTRGTWRHLSPPYCFGILLLLEA